jgi:hypothetical protein
MRLLAVFLLSASALLANTTATRAQPADCARGPAAGPALPLALDLAGRPGVPAGIAAQGFVAVPLGKPGYACAPVAPATNGALGDALRGPASPDLLRGDVMPRARTVPR